MSQAIQYYWLTYETPRVQSSVIGEMRRKFDLAIQIRSATITDELGQIALELTGEEKVIGAAVRWFRRHGVQVDHLAQGGVACP